MTEEQRKEMVSREFLRVLAYSQGFKIFDPPQDHGVDIVVCPVTERIEPNGKTRYLDSQHKLDFQIKSTTVASIAEEDAFIRYDLEVKNYNDLIARRADLLPLHLLVVVLSENPPQCVAIDAGSVSIFGRAFWYLPDDNAQASANASTVRIRLSKANLIGTDFVRNCYESLGIEV